MSSRNTGWNSLLIDHDRIDCLTDEIETASTPDQTIVVMLRGRQEISVKKHGIWRSAVYRAGTVGMTPGGQGNVLKRRVRRGGPPPEKAVMYVPERQFAETADHYRRAGQRGYVGPLTALAFDDPAIAEVALALLGAVRVGAPDLYAETTAQWLAVHLLAGDPRWRAIEDDRRNSGVLVDQRLQRVVEFMSEHLASPPTLGALAAEAGVSKFHFSRLFRERTGSTPVAYLLDLRLAAARRLLASGELDVGTVAHRCGFARATHFATAFGRRYGETPSAFRSRTAGRPGVLRGAECVRPNAVRGTGGLHG